MTRIRNAEISLDQLTRLRSFIVVADKQLTITWASEQVLRREVNALGLKVSDIFEPIESPEKILPLSIARNTGIQRILLKGEGCSIPLIGQWIPSRDGLILFASPDVRVREDLDKFSVDDFLEDDPTIGLLTAREEYIMSLKEAIHAADMVRHSDQLLQQFAENISEVCFVVDPQDYQILYVSPAYETVWGRTCESLYENPYSWVDAVHPEDRERILAALAKQKEIGRFDEEFRVRRPDNTVSWIRDRVFSMLDEHGQIYRLFGIAEDITERKQAELTRRQLEAQLVDAQKLESIGQLAVGIAHEINTPTQYVGDNTHFLQDSFRTLIPLLKKADELAEAVSNGTASSELADELKAALDESDVEYLREEIPRAIEQSLIGIDRVRKIVQSMKEFSHPGAEGMTSLDLNRAIESTITVATNEWKYVAEVKTDFDPELPPVCCLPGEFNQVILNVIVNAAHAIANVAGDGDENKGTITVSTHRDGEFVEIRIADTGTGIPEEVRGKIFDPFFTTKEVGKGSGQGLAIAHNVVVKKHGGTLDFETEIGKGTTFSIRIPIDRPRVMMEVS